VKSITKGIMIGAVGLFAMSASTHATTSSETSLQELNQNVTTYVATYRHSRLVSVDISYEFLNGRL